MCPCAICCAASFRDIRPSRLGAKSKLNDTENIAMQRSGAIAFPWQKTPRCHLHRIHLQSQHGCGRSSSSTTCPRSTTAACCSTAQVLAPVLYFQRQRY